MSKKKIQMTYELYNSTPGFGDASAHRAPYCALGKLGKACGWTEPYKEYEESSMKGAERIWDLNDWGGFTDWGRPKNHYKALKLAIQDLLETSNWELADNDFAAEFSKIKENAEVGS